MASSDPRQDLRERRLKAGLTQQELGDLIGVHRVTVRVAELGGPSSEATLLRLDAALDAHMARDGAVDALAAALHDLLCQAPFDVDHPRLDMARARFIEARMADRGWRPL